MTGKSDEHKQRSGRRRRFSPVVRFRGSLDYYPTLVEREHLTRFECHSNRGCDYAMSRNARSRAFAVCKRRRYSWHNYRAIDSQYWQSRQSVSLIVSDCRRYRDVLENVSSGRVAHRHTSRIYDDGARLRNSCRGRERERKHCARKYRRNYRTTLSVDINRSRIQRYSEMHIICSG